MSEVAGRSRIILSVLAAVCAVFFTLGNWAEAQSHDDSTMVYVRDILVDPSKILTEAEINGVVEPYEGRMLSISELYDVVEQINALYAERGYVTAMAILPPQTVDDGVVRISLVEGVVGAVLVEGNASTRSSYVTGRMTLRPGDLVRVETLERDIALFNGTNDVQLRAKLQPGASFGTTDYVLHVIEPPRWQGVLRYANAGRSEVGTNQWSLALTDRSFLGIRDRLSISIVSAHGTTGGSVGYEIPIDRKGSRLGATYYKNQIEIVSGAFEDVDIAAASSGGSVALSIPLIVRPEMRVTASIEHHVKNSGTFFSGTELIGGTVRTLANSIITQVTDDHRFLEIVHTVTGGSSDISDTTHRFLKYNGSLKRESRWRDLYTLKFRVMVQSSPINLLPNSEQFALGGIESVRGMPTGELVGDDGYFVSAQLERQVAQGVTLYAFLDHGAVYPYKGDDQGVTEEDFTTSVGLGANFQMLGRLTGTAVYGLPLKEEQRPQGGGGRLHFTVELSF